MLISSNFSLELISKICYMDFVMVEVSGKNENMRRCCRMLLCPKRFSGFESHPNEDHFDWKYPLRQIP